MIDPSDPDVRSEPVSRPPTVRICSSQALSYISKIQTTDKRLIVVRTASFEIQNISNGASIVQPTRWIRIARNRNHFGRLKWSHRFPNFAQLVRSPFNTIPLIRKACCQDHRVFQVDRLLLFMWKSILSDHEKPEVERSNDDREHRKEMAPAWLLPTTIFRCPFPATPNFPA